MSMNENLEVKVNELTNVIRGLSDRPVLSSADMNNLLGSLVRRVEETNEEGFTRLTSDLSESLLDVLDRKYNDIKERLSLFETFVASVEKNVQNPKIETEITRILNDIEALHSKMNSQELQTEGLVKSFDAFKNVSSSGQITKLCDEIVSISKSYDGIVEVLNNNFQEFLRRVETLSSREEFQRLRYSLESIDGNQNVLVSAMNAVNEKQDEIKNLIKQSSAAQTTEKFEQLQNILNQMNRLIIDTTSKADLEIVVDKIASVVDLLNDFRRSFDESRENDFKNVLSGQMNNIISRLEGLKMDSDSNVNEDIIRLYTSIAEFKDGVYSAINTQLNDVVASMDVQFDKITNSVVNATLDSGETVNNLAGEVQKLNSIVVDGLNAKTAEMKQDFQKAGQENVITIVNSVKGELSTLMNEISSLNNNDGISQLARSIENLQSGLDIDSLIIQIDQIKAALDFTPIKEQLALLNKDELIKTINGKIDLILDYVRDKEVLNKLEEIKNLSNSDNLYSALDSINQKIDFTSIEAKISSLKELLANADFSEDLFSIKEKLEQVDTICEELNSIKNVDLKLVEIKNQIEENLRLNVEKINGDKEAIEDIKEALKTIYELLSDSSEADLSNAALNEVKENTSAISSKISDSVTDFNSNLERAVNNINENLNSVNSKIDDSFEQAKSNLESSLNVLSEKINMVDLKLLDNNDEKLDEIKDQIELLYNFVRDVNVNSINDQIETLKTTFLTSNSENIKGVKDTISDFQNALALGFNAIKNGITENLDKEKFSDAFLPLFDEFSAKLNEKIISLETLIEETGALETEKIKTASEESFENIKTEIKSAITSFVDQVSNSQTAVLSDLIKTQTSEARLEVANYLKQESEILTAFFAEKTETSQKEILNKVAQIISARENSEARINLIKSVTENLSEILNNTNILKFGYDASSDILNEINGNISQIGAKIEETVSKSNSDNEEILTRIAKNLELINSKITASINENNAASEQNTVSFAEKIDSVEAKVSEAINVLNSSFEDKINLITANSELVETNLKDVISQNNSDIKNTITEIGENISSSNSKLNETILESNTNFENTLNSISENIKSIGSKIDNPKTDDREVIIDAIDDLNRNFISIQDKIEDSIMAESSNKADSIEAINGLENLIIEKFEEKKRELDEIKNNIISLITSEIEDEGKLTEIREGIVSALITSSNENKNTILNKMEEISGHIHENINGTRDKFEEVKNGFVETNGKFEDLRLQLNDSAQEKINEVKQELNKDTEKIIEQIREEAEEIKSSIENGIARNENDANALMGLSSMVEQKMNDKISILEALIDDNVSKLDDKTSEILNANNEVYKEILNDKIESAVDRLKSDYEGKLTDIQKIIDEKVYEIINRNNEIIKDELKLRAEATLKDLSKEFKDKISKIESVLIKDEESEENEEKYTLADVESDIAKIRLGIEKNNKLSNFKEFASRLVELKNINLENAKISRVIGADIMRFDGWLKNTTAKIELLAAKIEKSEKIKMEDLKTRLIQSEKNQAMPQKLEEAIMSIYKKYRSQETKIDDLVNKIENLSQKQSDTFDVKEFIDLFYDNTKKQENLMSRMDGIEDKMDLIQAKIDHIISSCIDE